MRVFLTGGTGLIGSHVAERLRARGDQVTALVRPTSDIAHLESIGCGLARGDLLDDPERTAAAMAGCDAVVHAGAKVFERGARVEFIRQNVEGTRNVLSAAASAAPRVVHLSSVAVYSGLSMKTPLTEDRWTEADPDRQPAYPASKSLAEREAWAMHERGAIRLTTVRPCVVYGERDRAATRVLLKLLGLPLIPVPAGGRAGLPLVYAGNVAAGILAVLDRPVAEGRAYNLAQDHRITTREALELFGRELGRRPRVLPLPALPLRAVAATAEGISRALPGVRPLGFRRAVRSMITDNPYDSSRARLELGWGGLITHEEGVRRTMAWQRAREAD